MLKRFLTSMLLLWGTCATLGAVICSWIGSDSLKEYGNIRIACATGLFAIGAATLTCRVTWLPKLKEAYETAEHTENVGELHERGRKIDYYGGFHRLAKSLNMLTMLIVVGVAVQLFVGMWHSPIAAGICMGTTVATFVLFGYLLNALHSIEATWIQKLEDEAVSKHRSPSLVVR